MTPCSSTMQAHFDPEHTHTCDGGTHMDNLHLCPSCGRLWGRR